MIRSIYIILMSFLLQPAFSQTGFQAILDSVAANNKTLAANYQYFETQKLNAKTGIFIANPSVTFDRLSNSTINYSESVVSQSFDFPSAYVHKSKIANLAALQFEEQYRKSKLEIYANTVQVYTELVGINRKIAILMERQQMALQLQSGIEKRLNAGDANIFESNRVRSELAKVQSELQIAESLQKSLRLKLTELNGGKSIALTDSVFPVLDVVVTDSSVKKLSANNPQLRQLEKESLIAQRSISLHRSLSLPKFEIGYRQDRNTGQTFNGFHAGMTIPLFENKNTVRSAKARQIYATKTADAFKMEIESQVSQIIEEYNAVSLSASKMNDFFNTLHTPELLLKAYKAGQINYTAFFSEYESYQQMALYVEELNQKAASLQLQLYVLSGI